MGRHLPRQIFDKYNLTKVYEVLETSYVRDFEGSRIQVSEHYNFLRSLFELECPYPPHNSSSPTSLPMERRERRQVNMANIWILIQECLIQESSVRRTVNTIGPLLRCLDGQGFMWIRPLRAPILAAFALLLFPSPAFVADIQVCFSPASHQGCDPQETIISAINAARRTILVQAYALTSREITTALIQIASRSKAKLLTIA